MKNHFIQRRELGTWPERKGASCETRPQAEAFVGLGAPGALQRCRILRGEETLTDSIAALNAKTKRRSIS